MKNFAANLKGLVRKIKSEADDSEDRIENIKDFSSGKYTTKMLKALKNFSNEETEYSKECEKKMLSYLKELKKLEEKVKVSKKYNITEADKILTNLYDFIDKQRVFIDKDNKLCDYTNYNDYIKSKNVDAELENDCLKYNSSDLNIEYSEENNYNSKIKKISKGSTSYENFDLSEFAKGLGYIFNLYKESIERENKIKNSCNEKIESIKNIVDNLRSGYKNFKQKESFTFENNKLIIDTSGEELNGKIDTYLTEDILKEFNATEGDRKNIIEFIKDALTTIDGFDNLNSFCNIDEIKNTVEDSNELLTEDIKDSIKFEDNKVYLYTNKESVFFNEKYITSDNEFNEYYVIYDTIAENRQNELGNTYKEYYSSAKEKILELNDKKIGVTNYMIFDNSFVQNTQYNDCINYFGKYFQNRFTEVITDLGLIRGDSNYTVYTPAIIIDKVYGNLKEDIKYFSESFSNSFLKRLSIDTEANTKTKIETMLKNGEEEWTI